MRATGLTLGLALAVAGVGAGCGGGGGTTTPPTAPPAVTPDSSFAALGAVPVPAGEPVTAAKVTLGHHLFFDDRFSADITLSCASCHDSRLGWGDGNAISRAYAGTEHWRNAPTAINAAYLDHLFWTGRAPNLQKQAHGAITGAIEGNGDPAMIEERLAQVPGYVALFREAFGAARPTYPLALDAIAAFERATCISTDSPFDRFLRGERTALDDAATRGLALFQGKARCVQCHSGPLLTDQLVHATQVPSPPSFDADALRQITVRMQRAGSAVPAEVARAHSGDLGHFHDTGRIEHLRAFRTAPLRYLKFTAPYMHNGVFETLEEVVEFYDRGGGSGTPKDPLLRPLGLTASERDDLVAFLESGTGTRVDIETPAKLPYAPTAD